MNKDLIDGDTGEVLAVSSTRFPTIFNPPVSYDREVVEGESETDTTLYEPLQSIVERCERAGMVRQLLANAQQLRFDSKSEISDEDLLKMVFTGGDMLEDINTTVEVALGDLLKAVENSPATRVAEKSEAAPELSKEVSVVSDKNVSDAALPE